MTNAQIIAQINYWTARAAELVEVQRERLMHGAQSATVSAGGASKSYTNWTDAQISAHIRMYQSNAAKWKAKLNGTAAGLPRMVRVVRR